MSGARTLQDHVSRQNHTNFFRKWGNRLLIVGAFSAAPSITVFPATANAVTSEVLRENEAMDLLPNIKKEGKGSEDKAWFADKKKMALMKMLATRDGHELAKSIASSSFKEIATRYKSKHGEELSIGKKIELSAYLMFGEGSADSIAAELGGCISVPELENAREKIKAKIELAEKEDLEARKRLAENKQKQKLKKEIEEKAKMEAYEKAKNKEESLSHRIWNIAELILAVIFTPDVWLVVIPIVVLAAFVVGAVVSLFKKD